MPSNDQLQALMAQWRQEADKAEIASRQARTLGKFYADITTAQIYRTCADALAALIERDETEGEA